MDHGYGYFVFVTYNYVWYPVLSVFRLSLFCLNHSAILSTLVLRSLQSLSISAVEQVTLLSSAYTFEVQFLTLVGIQDEEFVKYNMNHRSSVSA